MEHKGYDGMITAIIVAGGSGRRVGANKNKVLLPVAGQPLLAYTLAPFREVKGVRRICLVAAAGEEQQVREIARTCLPKLDITVVTGGDTRGDSVRAAIAALPAETDSILIHDAARPYVTAETVQAVVDALASHEGVVPGKYAVSTVRRVTPAGVTIIPRDEVFLTETPQGFRRSAWMRMYALPAETIREATDDAALLECIGVRPFFLVTAHANDKITTMEDYRRFVQDAAMGMTRVGYGYDIHTFSDQRPLWLGGIRIPHSHGLAGHSDADVVIHAVADALLGAAALGDIGEWFPPSDERWRGLRGADLLREVARALTQRGYAIVHIDVTVIAEEPHLGIYKQAMQECLAEILQVSAAAVSVKATTNERIGALGRREGIAAQAVATVSERMISIWKTRQ